MGKPGGRKEGPGRAVLDRAYGMARELHPREVHRYSDFLRFIRASTQNNNTWIIRGVPAAKLLAIAERLGVPVESLRGEEPPITTTYDLGELLTNEEAMLLASFRQADENTRRKILALARSALMAKIPTPSPRAVPIDRR